MTRVVAPLAGLALMAGGVATARAEAAPATPAHVEGTLPSGAAYVMDVPARLERHRPALQPRVRPAGRAEPGPQRAQRRLPRRAAGAGVRADRLVVRDHRLGRWRRPLPGPARHARRVRPPVRPRPPDARLGDVDRRHDHHRPRRAARPPVRRRARDVRPAAGRGRELEQHARPGLRRPDAAGARTPTSRWCASRTRRRRSPASACSPPRSTPRSRPRSAGPASRSPRRCTTSRPGPTPATRSPPPATTTPRSSTSSGRCR